MPQMNGTTKQLLDALAREAFDEALADRVLLAFYAAYGSRFEIADPAAPTDDEINGVFVGQVWSFVQEITAAHEINRDVDVARDAAAAKAEEEIVVKPLPVPPKGGGKLGSDEPGGVK